MEQGLLGVLWMTGSICTGKEVGTRTDARLRTGTRRLRGDRLGGKETCKINRLEGKHRSWERLVQRHSCTPPADAKE